jgi:hypothetical protein
MPIGEKKWCRLHMSGAFLVSTSSKVWVDAERPWQRGTGEPGVVAREGRRWGG